MEHSCPDTSVKTLDISGIVDDREVILHDIFVHIRQHPLSPNWIPFAIINVMLIISDDTPCHVIGHHSHIR
jgi:hypothetical protein